MGHGYHRGPFWEPIGTAEPRGCLQLPTRRVAPRRFAHLRALRQVPMPGPCGQLWASLLSARGPFALPPAVGQKLEKWTATPFDLLAFGPRVGAGALLSLPERLQKL